MTDVHQAGFTDLPAVTAYRLWALRSAVFVVEQECVYLDLDGLDLAPGTRHLWVEEDGEPVAYLRVLDVDGARRVGRVVTAPSHRGRGHAAALVREALRLVPGHEVRISAQAHLQHWYEGFGFVVSGPAFVEDGIPHVPMRRDPAP